MANYNNLKAGIDAVIKTNGRQEISGAALNTQLKNMITELGAGYQYMGMATPATNPGTPDAKVFYLASEAGTYTNFGGIVINEGEVCALVWNGTWTKQVTGAATADQVSQLGQDFEKILNGALFSLADVEKSLSPISTESGYLNLDGEISPNTQWETAKYDISGVACVFVSGREYSGGLLAALYDSNDLLIRKVKIASVSQNYVDYFVSCLGASYIKVSANQMLGISVSVKPVSAKNVILLKGMASQWQTIAETGWKPGDIMYNTDSKQLRRCIATTSTGGVLYFENYPFSKYAVYICNGDIYLWDGVDSLVLPSTLNSVRNNLQDITDDYTITKADIYDTLLEMANGHAGVSLTALESGDGIINIYGEVNSGYTDWNIKKYDVSNENFVYVTGRSATTSAVAAFYKEDDTLLGSVVNFGTGQNYVDLCLLVPSGAKYLRVSNYTPNGQADAKEYSTWGNTSIIRNNLLGKTVAFIGDSITAGGSETAPVDKLYHRIFAEKYSCINRNLGVWSTCIANNTTNGESANRFVTRATAANLADCSLIVVFGGTNDFSYDSKAIGDLFTEETITQTGNIGDKRLVAPTDTDTFAGALHELITTIRTNAPTVPIVFMTPLKRGRYASSNPISGEKNIRGDYMEDFVDAIKKICAFYSIPVFDCNSISELDFTNQAIATLYSSDSLHPNIAGHKLLGELLFRFVENNVYIG